MPEEVVMPAHSPHPKHFQASVLVESSPAEARALFNLLTMIIRQPDSAGDIYTVFNGYEILGLKRYANRLGEALAVQSPHVGTSDTDPTYSARGPGRVGGLA